MRPSAQSNVIIRKGEPICGAAKARPKPWRTATVAALFYTLEATAQDDAAELAEALLSDLIRDAEAAEKRSCLRSLRTASERNGPSGRDRRRSAP